MVVEYNEIFKNLTEGDLSNPFFACEIVDFILKEDFVVIDECYYFKSQAPKSLFFSKDLIDRTGNECFFNKLSLDTKFDSKKRLDVFKCGVSAAFELSNKLSKIFEREKFNVIFSYNYDGASLRFHKDRKDENWLAKDLNNYKEDAILLIKN